jgi:hypothetical protein
MAVHANYFRQGLIKILQVYILLYTFVYGHFSVLIEIIQPTNKPAVCIKFDKTSNLLRTRINNCAVVYKLVLLYTA